MSFLLQYLKNNNSFMKSKFLESNEKMFMIYTLVVIYSYNRDYTRN